jgi:hypothetical protein
MDGSVPETYFAPVSGYPDSASARDRFVLDRRRVAPEPDAWRHQGLIVEDERGDDGGVVRTATVLLTGRECPWRCAMCDLWKFTTAADTPRGATAAQVAAAREELRAASEDVTLLKLYNAGSFFDPRAVPEPDYEDIAAALAGLAQVVVESHPSLIGPRVDRFLDALQRRAASIVRLEVAMGLETSHREALDRLNKRMTVEDFVLAARALRERGATMRTFLLIWPPFVPQAEQLHWLLESIRVAFSAGAAVVSLVPTRPGNGALETLAAEGAFVAPRLDDIESSIEAAVAGRYPGRIFVDLWDLRRFASCEACFARRRARLHRINLEQQVPPQLPCRACGFGASS